MRRIEQCLMQGFTTVRDAGGADYGFREAARVRPLSGPAPARLRPLRSRRPAATATSGGARSGSTPMDCCVGMVGLIADGADEVRRAARENIRHDVDQIKIMASGGAMSPGDELDTTQYTVDEMRAAVEEAQRGRQVRPGPRLLRHRHAQRHRGRRALHRARQPPRRRRRAGHQGGRRLPGADDGHLRGHLRARARTTASATTRSRRSTWRARRASRA